MFLLPHVMMPALCARIAYQESHVEFRITEPCTVSVGGVPVKAWKSIQRGSQEYNSTLQRNAGFMLKQQIQPFLDEMGIRKDLIILHTERAPYEAEGTNFLTKYDAVVHIPCPQPVIFCVKREIFHIKYHRSVVVYVATAVCSLFASIMSAHFKVGGVKTFLLSVLVTFVADQAFQQLYEVLADNFAIKHGTAGELKSAITYFQGQGRWIASALKTPEQGVKRKLLLLGNNYKITKITKQLNELKAATS